MLIHTVLAISVSIIYVFLNIHLFFNYRIIEVISNSHYKKWKHYKNK